MPPPLPTFSSLLMYLGATVERFLRSHWQNAHIRGNLPADALLQADPVMYREESFLFFLPCLMGNQRRFPNCLELPVPQAAIMYWCGGAFLLHRTPEAAFVLLHNISYFFAKNCPDQRRCYYVAPIGALPTVALLQASPLCFLMYPAERFPALRFSCLCFCQALLSS